MSELERTDNAILASQNDRAHFGTKPDDERYETYL